MKLCHWEWIIYKIDSVPCVYFKFTLGLLSKPILRVKVGFPSNKSPPRLMLKGLRQKVCTLLCH